ncbi:hypothetical protein ABN069_21975 [Providencia rettgeri]
MLNKLRAFFSPKAPQPQQSGNDSLILTDKEVIAVKYAHNVITTQMLMGDVFKEGGKEYVFSEDKYVTPWVIGYLAGILDYSIQSTGAGEHARFELQQFFIHLHFSSALREKVDVVDLICHSDMSGKDTGGFCPNYGKDYIAGAQAGFNTPPSTERDTPKLELFWYLSNNCNPRS